MTQTLVIESRFPSLNATLAAAKRHWSVYAKEKRRLTLSVALLAKAQGIKPVKRAIIRFCWYEANKRRDPDNISAAGKKPILDGLVEAGVLKDDGWSVIQGLEDRFIIDKEWPRVEVTITPTSHQENAPC